MDGMNAFFYLIHELVVYFPLAAVVGLFLGACNIPISEDLIIITGGLLSSEEPELLLHNLGAIYFGAVGANFIPYFVGRAVRRGSKRVKFFSRMVPEQNLNRMSNYLHKYGIFAFIVGRFIPFGVRNLLFFTSGFGNLRIRTFILYNAVATLISVNTLFFLTYYLGEQVEKHFRIIGITLFVIVVLLSAALAIRFFILLRKKRQKM